jgi:DNA-binding PadR family transcriptional regulator
VSLAHAILGFLAQEPMTGYELKACFDTSVSYFWQADQAQIYRTLDKLGEQEFATFAVEVQEGRPNRKVYSLTEAGRAELDDWLTQHQPQQAWREPFLVQLFFGENLSNQEVLKLIEGQIADHQALLDKYQTEVYPWFDQPMLPRKYQLQLLTLQYGIQFEQMTLAWLRQSAEQIKAMNDKTE